MLKEIAIVGGDLDDKVLAAEFEPVSDHLRVTASVIDPRIGVRGEVRVLREDVLGRDELRELDEQALLAETHVERVEALHEPELLDGDDALAGRRHAEIDDGTAKCSTAEAAWEIDSGPGGRVRAHGSQRSDRDSVS